MFERTERTGYAEVRSGRVFGGEPMNGRAVRFCDVLEKGDVFFHVVETGADAADDVLQDPDGVSLDGVTESGMQRGSGGQVDGCIEDVF